MQNACGKGLRELKSLLKKIFKNADEMKVLHGGQSLICRGVITPMKGEEPWDVKEMGLFSTPLSLFMGDCEVLETGDEITFGGEKYRVVHCRMVQGFGYLYCMRAVVERVMESEY